MPRVLVSTFPFAEVDGTPIRLLREAGIELALNPLGRKLTSSELGDLLPGFDGLIAGTEQISDQALASATELKIISRVGVGLDSVDLEAVRTRGIRLSYTPEAPVAAVAELTIGLIVSLMRQINVADVQLHHGRWHRHFGRRIGDSVIGIIGAGRIGSRVIDLLVPFQPRKILVNDLDLRPDLLRHSLVEPAEKSGIYAEADLISIHTPLTPITRRMIRYPELMQMKPGAFLVNTARGGIIDEDDLVKVLHEGHLAGVALDVFEREPYSGPLVESPRCLLTSHMGSMSIDCRSRMELEATEEVIRCLSGQPLLQEVPEHEYRSGSS